jgi:TolB-like protein/class 3 adenylate cyclase
METNLSTLEATDVRAAVNITRRLAAIAFLDVAEWSRLVEKDDVETMRAWKALRVDIVEPKIREQGGRQLEIRGDGILVEFPSAVAAVTWALDVQRTLLPIEPARRANPLRVRIGINVEDVIVDEGQLIGDGVNIAARIHQAAEPGQIVITHAVRDYIWNKMPVSFRDLGDQELKHISRSIRVFEVGAPTSVATIPPQSQPQFSWTRRPSLAVLPFRNIGDDPGQTYFGDGITEEIITRLARSHSLYVIARSSTLRYRDSQMAPRQIASELGVRYLLEGSVRRQAAQLRIAAELVDAVSNHTIWADRFDGADDNIFAFQDQIATSIAGALEPKLYQTEATRALKKPTESLDAYDCVLRALSLLYRFNGNDFATAGSFLRRALALDPHFAEAQAYYAWWLNLAAGEGRSSDAAGDRAKAISAAMAAVQLDPNDAFCLAVAGHVQAFLAKDLRGAVDLFDRALVANENSAFAWGVSASTYCFLGQPDEALARIRNAWRLSPFDPLSFWFLTVSGLAEFVASRYDQAIGWLRKAERRNPRFIACFRTLAASLALSGEIAAAEAAGTALLSIDPHFKVSSFTSWYPLPPDALERLGSGLRLAGLPE